MTEEITIQRKVCDGCGAVDDGYHMSAGHYTTEWSNIKGFDVCKLCEVKLGDKLMERAKVNEIEDILLSIKMSQPETLLNPVLKTFGNFRPLDRPEGMDPTLCNTSGYVSNDNGTWVNGQFVGHSKIT